MNDYTRVLIGCNGGLTGVYLAKNLSQVSNLILCGADTSDITVGKYFVQNQYNLPPATDSSYIEALVELLNHEHIDIYLPTHSKEMRVVAQNEKRIKNETNTKFIVSPYDTFEALDDKWIANVNLEKAGFVVPKRIEGFDSTYPIFMKRNRGSGGSGSSIIDTSMIHRAYLESTGDYSFYELVKGNEYTVDCIYDDEGTLLGYNQRKRIKTIGGAVSITENSANFDIYPWLKKITKHWKFCGCVNFQYIVRDNIPYFIDINLRYPSGGLPATVAAGLDIPKMIINLLLGKKVECREISRKSIRMYRYFEEIIEDVQ